jgi:hypothetical protein
VSVVHAQAVERSDVPARGNLRVTFDPRIVTWDRRYVNTTAWEPLGAPLTGDTVGSAHIPAVAQLEQDVRTATGLSGFLASLGRGLLSVRQERRSYPVTAELGVTDRLAVSVMVPLVRVATRTRLQLSPTGSNLGRNPLHSQAGAVAVYDNFFTQFEDALAELADSIAAMHYGCPTSPKCAQAQALAAQGDAVRDALHRAVYGLGSVGSPFMPLADSDAGRAIGTTVGTIQLDLDTAYHIPSFADSLLLSVDSLGESTMAAALTDPVGGFGYRFAPFRNSFRIGLGDVELAAKYRLVAGSAYRAAVVGIARLPTAGRDSADDFLRQSLGDHQLDFEGRVIQELIVAGRAWLNLAVRAGVQRAGTRFVRVASPAAVLVPAQAGVLLRWDPGDYVAVDFAPLYRVNRRFGAGLTLGYWSRGRDHFTFRSPQDATDLAGRLGMPAAASVLDEGTSERWLRVGAAVTVVGASVEGGFSIEQTISGEGGRVPAATVFRIVLRKSWTLF